MRSRPTARSAPSNRQKIEDLIAQKKPELRLRCKCPGKTQRRLLLVENEWREEFLVSAKSFGIVAVCAVQFARKDIRRHHGQSRTLPSEQRDAECRIADQRYAPPRPQSLSRIHSYLAHTIEIEIVRWRRARPESVDIPTHCFRSVSATALFGRGCRCFRTGSSSAKINRNIVRSSAHRKPPHLLTDFGVHHITSSSLGL